MVAGCRGVGDVRMVVRRRLICAERSWIAVLWDVWIGDKRVERLVVHCCMSVV